MAQEEEELTSSLGLRGDEDPDLTGVEQKQVGGLAWRVYQTYWVAVGGVLAASILMSLLLMQGLDRQLSFSVLYTYSVDSQQKSRCNNVPSLKHSKVGATSVTVSSYVYFVIQCLRMFLTGGCHTGSQS